MKKILLTTLLLITGLATTQITVAKSKHVELSGPAKDFILKSNKGKNIRLSDHRGEVVMLNFWASWCGPCREEMPLLDKLSQRYAPAGFTLLSVNTEEDINAANGLLKEIPVSFPVLYDSSQKVSDAYKVDSMPSTVLIDCDGNLNYLHRGYKKGDISIYKKRVKKLLASCK